MVTYGRFREVRPAELERAADGWQRISGCAGEAKDRVDDRVVAKMRKSLEGEGVDAALDRLRRLSRNLHYTQVESGLVGAALNGLASELRAAKKKLDEAVADAEAEKFTVGPDGSVHWVSKETTVPLAPEQSVAPRPGPPLFTSPSLGVDPQRVRAQGYADRIGAALTEATEADERYARALDRLTADNDLDVTGEDWADAQGDMGVVQQSAGKYLEAGVPEGKSPQENAAWWRGLSEDERDGYTALFPASVGALDGLPAEVRDDANRTVLAEKRAEYQTQLAGVPPEPPRYRPGGGSPYAHVNPGWREWDEKWSERKSHLEASLKGMDAIQRRFDATGVEGLPEAYLLGFAPESDGRAIVATGNPDKADHTAVYVPGTTSSLEKIGGDINRMTDMWRETQSVSPGSSVSTITWLGYDAPDSVVKDAPFSHYADDGAPALNRFMDGLDASHDPAAGNHSTVVGHSYGTTLVGSAARQGDLNADDVVFAGSPGVQVGRAGEMDVPEGHVWNQEADGDHVPELGRLGHGHREWHWDTGFDWVTPSDERFGAQQMATDTDGHSGYWDQDSRSLKNQARVVTGHYEEVERE